MGKLARTSFIFPSAMFRDLDYVSGRLGVSRLAFFAFIAVFALSDVCALFEEMFGLPESFDAFCFRGESIALVRMRLDSLEKMMEGDLVTLGVKGHV